MQMIVGWLLVGTLTLSVGARLWLMDGSDTPEPAAAESSETADSTIPDGLVPQEFLPGERRIPTEDEEDGFPIFGGDEEEEAELGKQSSMVADSLPVVSEASFFGLIGFALGYTSRKVIKLCLIFIAVFFIGIQGLSYAGVLNVDWSRAVRLVNDVVLNLKENRTFLEVLKDRIPSAGALTAGYLLGFKRG